MQGMQCAELSKFEDNSTLSNFKNNSAQCMPRINKDKGKQGNAKTIPASVAERAGVPSADDLGEFLDGEEGSPDDVDEEKASQVQYKTSVCKSHLHLMTYHA